jgi:tetratricopeptide (TPR) repeat protein
MAYWANILIAEKNLTLAQQLVQRLDSANPKSADPNRWLVVELQSQLDHAQGKTPEAARRIAGYTAKNEAESLAMARRLEEYKDTPNAEKMLKAIIEKDSSPFAGLAYAAFLARRGDVGDALTRCEALIGKSPRELPAPVVAGMTLEFLGYGQSKDMYEHVERWLKNADGRDARPAAFMRADALDRKGDYQGAKRAYEDLLEKESKNPLVLFPLARLVLLPQGASVTDAERAEHLLTDAIGVSGPRSHLMELRAAAKLRQGHADCIADLRAILAEQPTATGYLLLSVALRRFKDNAGADDALEEYIQRDSTLFKLTEKALVDLGTQKVPKPVLEKLRPLIDNVFSRKAFEQKIAKAFGDAKTNLTPDFRGLILDSAVFNVSSVHPLEAIENQRLRNEAYRGSP